MMVIQNKFDAEFCGKVPLHQTNLIQPHGYLLIVDSESLEILQASENTAELLERDIFQIVQCSLGDFLPSEQAEMLGEFAAGGKEDMKSFVCTFNHALHFAMASLPPLSSVEGQKEFAPYFFLEIEKNPIRPGRQGSFIDRYRHLKSIMDTVQMADTIQSVCSIAALKLKEISGFDKVMVYRFDDQWNGDVIAEEMEPGMESYLGLKFPASDIPPQARELYKKIPYRLIPDINYEPVKLYPVISPRNNIFTDLSVSNLRSVAGVHLEYLRNMKIAASMSTRILVNGRLWGLISCHHRKPKYPDYENRSLFELVSGIISARIESMTAIEAYSFLNRSMKLQLEIMEELFRKKQGFFPGENLLKLLNAGGVAVIMNGEVEIIGITPPVAEIMELVPWIQAMGITGLYTKDSFGEVFEPFLKFSEIASGLMILPLEPDSLSYIVAFRPEVIQQVNWGGNPNEVIRFEPDGKKYHPRASFEIWQQVLSKTAVSWRPEELEMAESFRKSLKAYLFNKTEG